MANLIDKDYFIGEINLPKNDFDNIELFITRREPIVLKNLLGYDEYKAMIDGTANSPYKELIEGAEYEVQYNGNTRTVKWNGLQNEDKISLLAYYVYCYYMRNLVSSTQSVGETKSKQENSYNADIYAKVLAADTLFEELYGYYGQDKLVPSAYNYLYAHKDDFPNWEFTDMQANFNSHGL